MSNSYVTKRADGRYQGRIGGKGRASTVQETQAQAIEEMRRMHPDNPVLAQRVRYRAEKPAPDKFRRGR